MGKHAEIDYHYEISIYVDDQKVDVSGFETGSEDDPEFDWDAVVEYFKDVGVDTVTDNEVFGDYDPHPVEKWIAHVEGWAVD